MSVRVPVYDAGMLIALADRKPMAVTVHQGLKRAPHRPVILGAVLAQVWRPQPKLVHALADVLKDSTVTQARSATAAMRGTRAGRPECLACAAPPDITDWRRIGTALGEARLPPKKRPDAVDAWVAWTAMRHGSAVIFTSDTGDLEAYLAALEARDVHTVAV